MARPPSVHTTTRRGPPRLLTDSTATDSSSFENAMTSWGYTKTTGPSTWANNFAAAGGNRQSPIDIVTTETVNVPELRQRPIVIDYDSSHSVTLENTGYGFKVSMREGSDSVVQGAPMDNDYLLAQFHFHWGKTDKSGSEHTVDGEGYASEVHLVHWNSVKYETLGQAAEEGDGLCVLGTFFKVGEHHPEIQKLIDRFDEIKYKGDKVTLTEGFDLTTLLPANRTYWTYPGSLTTPPCNECVIWIVFKNPIEMSAEQLDAFRELCSYCSGDTCPSDEFEGKVQVNCRPPLDRGTREVQEAVF